MSDDLESCRKMQLMYFRRAKSDPLQNGKWLERAERWAEHARREEAWLSYQRSARQQMNAGGRLARCLPNSRGNATELRQGFCRANSDERFPLFSA